MTLAKIEEQELFTPAQEKMILDTYAGGATPSEAKVLMTIARVRRLNPLLGQIHFVKRQGKGPDGKYRDMWSTQVSIDGLRAIAERSGLYDGQDAPIFEEDDKGNPLIAKVAVYRKDWARPAWGIAHFKEFAQRKQDGSLTKFWKEKAHVMLAKCAESAALRKAFPEQTSGLYSPEEMGNDAVETVGAYEITEDGEVIEKKKRRAPEAPAMDPTPKRLATTEPAPSVDAAEDDEEEAEEPAAANAAPTPDELHKEAKLSKGAKKGSLMSKIPVPGLKKYRDLFPDLDDAEKAALEYWIGTVPWE